MAQDLAPHGVASLGRSPGWMRTELVLRAFEADGERWEDVPALATTESTGYIGRAVVALVGDPGILRRTGQMLRVVDVARAYGFTDTDGRQPATFEAVGAAPADPAAPTRS